MKLHNEKGALLHAPIPKSATPRYQHCKPAQACFLSWQREAARLFNEYWRTGDKRHLAAFVRHVVAMRAHQARAAQ
jgi:hypothetical protein